jgi:hypothetical protein
MTVTDDIKMDVTHDRQERQPITAVWRNGGFSASFDSFVVGSSAVLRINICGKNPPLRQAANRYFQLHGFVSPTPICILIFRFIS